MCQISGLFINHLSLKEAIIHVYYIHRLHTNLYSAKNRENESEALIRCMSSLLFAKVQ